MVPYFVAALLLVDRLVQFLLGLVAAGLPLQMHSAGGMFARRATFFINYPDFSPRFTLSWRSPLSRPHCTAHLPYKAHCNKATAVNSTTPNVICIVLDKQHWSHKCGCQYIQYNSAPYTHHKLRRWSASGNTTHTSASSCLILPHLTWRPSCFGQSKHEAGHASMVRRGGDGLASGCKIV